jgi:hypothetical protein
MKGTNPIYSIKAALKSYVSEGCTSFEYNNRCVLAVKQET